MTGLSVASEVVCTLPASGCLMTSMSLYMALMIALSSSDSHLDRLVDLAAATVITSQPSLFIAHSKLSLVRVDGS